MDVAKGISIILVALFHSKMRAFVPQLIDAMSVFRMPLFFFLSGVFFSALGAPGHFLRQKFDALLKPYFATLVLVAVLAGAGVAFPAAKFPMPEWAGILYGGGETIRLVPLWFLTHLFAVYCFVYLVFRSTGFPDRPRLFQFGVLAAMICVGVAFIDAFWYERIRVLGTAVDLPGLPFSLDLILVSSTFFMAGSLLRREVVRFRPRGSWVVIAGLVFAAVTLLSDAYLDLNKRVYEDPLPATLGAACGIYLVIALAFHLARLPLARRVLMYFGASSLFVLIFHHSVGVETYRFLDSQGPDRLNFAFALLAFVLSLAVPLAIKGVIARVGLLSLLYFPLQSSRLLRRLRKAPQ